MPHLSGVQVSRGSAGATSSYPPSTTTSASSPKIPTTSCNVLADTPDDSSHGIPGLRPVGVEGPGTALVLQHLPTGASLRMRYHDFYKPRRRIPPWFFPTNWQRLRRDPILGPQERDALHAIPRMHENAVDLLAGLVARLTCHNDDDGWAFGWMIRDPILRPFREDSDFDFIQLWGNGAEWTLRWGGCRSVPASDVAHALTHPYIGIPCARITHSGETRAKVTLGKASLSLEVHDISISEYFSGTKHTELDKA